MVLPWCMFLGEKGTSEERRRFEGIEKILPRTNSPVLLGPAASNQVCGPILIGGEALETGGLGAQIAEVRCGERRVLAVGADLVYGNQAIEMRQRHRMMQKQVREAKDRGIRANSDGQGDQGD